MSHLPVKHSIIIACVFLLSALMMALLFTVTPRTSAAGEFTAVDTPFPSIDFSSVTWGDYDNDDDLDALLTGSIGGSTGPAIARVYRNDGGGVFTDTNASLTGVVNSSVAWGDYDNDGDLDIALTGAPDGGNTGIAKIYRNDAGLFTDIQAPLLGVYLSSVDWGDYDNDGDLDLLIVGSADYYHSSGKVYRNDGNDVFTDINAGLAGAGWGSARWGDYDNDSDLDILLVGCPDANGCEGSSVWLYRNDGRGVFTPVNTALASVSRGSAAWGDYDNDGDLDILMARSGESKVYRNDGHDIFTDIAASLPGGAQGMAIWGDYDNDGDLDILLTGIRALPGPILISAIYRNDGGDAFTDSGINFTAVADGSVAWGDYDNDHDLDLLLTGCIDVYCPKITQLYRNETSNANSLPTLPANLTASSIGNSVVLSWTAASDAQTPASGLTYNLRVGTTPSGTQIMSPLAAPTGYRRIVQSGNVDHGLTATLDLLTNRTYYWSIQAIDTTFAGSAFAPEASFTLPSPAVQFERQFITVTEAAGTIPVAVTLNARSAVTTTVQYTTNSGTALAGSDFLTATGFVTFMPGMTATTFNVSILDDTVVEVDEAFDVVLSDPVSATLGSPLTTTITILANDATVQFDQSSFSVDEGVGAAPITVTLNEPYSLTVTARYSTLNGTATAHQDYEPVLGLITFTPGTTRTLFYMPIIDDAIDEPDETVVFQLSDPTNATLGEPATTALTIKDNDPTPLLHLPGPIGVLEHAGQTLITLTLSGPSEWPVTVYYSTTDQTASAGSDYIAVTGTVGFARDVTTTVIAVPIIDDNLIEPTESLELDLSDPVNVIPGTPFSTTVEIIDNDPTVHFDRATYQVSENAGTALITVTLNTVISTTVTVQYTTTNGTALAYSDYFPVSGLLTFTPGITLTSFGFPIINDDIAEAPETVNLLLHDSVNANLNTLQTAELTIIDDEPLPTIQLQGPISVTENTAVVTVSATLSGTTALTANVYYYTVDVTTWAGSDYQPTWGVLEFVPGVTTTLFTIPIIDDNVIEADEDFEIRLIWPWNAMLGSPFTTTVTIIDNDPTVQFEQATYQVAENAGTVPVTVTLNAAPSLTVTVQYSTTDITAEANADYVPSVGVITFTPQVTAALIPIPILDDALIEPPKTFAVLLSTPWNATLGSPYTIPVTIMDGDRAVYLPLILR